MLNTPFSPWPCFTDEEANAVQEVLLSNKVNYWTGEQGRKFEKAFAAWSDCEHAIAVANGTLALELALKALDIGSGDEVIVTPRTFLASVSSVVTAGATPVFVDVDENTQSITAETIAPAVTSRTKAVIVVHLAGMPAPMEDIMELSAKCNFFVIEDCAQAHGAKYKGRSVGSIGHVGAWSFCQDKIMTTGGEGGMVTTNDKKLWSKMWSFKDHGKSFKAVYERQHPPGFRWLHDTFGTNWRLTEMQSVLGLIQLQRMTDWHRARCYNAQRIRGVAKRFLGVRLTELNSDTEHAWYKLYMFVLPEYLNTGWSRDRIVEEIVSTGVPCMQGSCSEVYLEKAFNGTGWRPENRLPVAQRLGETSLMFLVHPSLTEEEIQITCEVIDSVFSKAFHS